MPPSTFTVVRTSPESTSLARAVIRSRSPRRWNPPVTTHRAPTSRPSLAASSDSPCEARPVRRLSTSQTRSQPMTARPETPFRSAVTVSMIPVPSQSSSGLFVMFANARTATAFAGPAAGRPRPLRTPSAPRRARRPRGRVAPRASSRAALPVLLEHPRDDGLELRGDARRPRARGAADRRGGGGRASRRRSRPRTDACRRGPPRAGRRARTRPCARRPPGRAPAPATCTRRSRRPRRGSTAWVPRGRRSRSRPRSPPGPARPRARSRGPSRGPRSRRSRSRA